MNTTSFYHNCLSPELLGDLEGELDKLLPDQLSMNEEVGIHRLLCKDLVKKWSDSQEMLRIAKLGEDPQVLSMAHMQVHIAGEAMAKAFDRQSQLTSSAASTDGKMREILTSSTLMLFLRAVMQQVNIHFNDGTERGIAGIEAFEGDLKGCITVQDANGDQLSVESQFGAMLATIPEPVEEVID